VACKGERETQITFANQNAFPAPSRGTEVKASTFRFEQVNEALERNIKIFGS